MTVKEESKSSQIDIQQPQKDTDTTTDIIDLEKICYKYPDFWNDWDN